MEGEELAGLRTARTLRFGFSPPADTLPDALRARDVPEPVGKDIDNVRSRLRLVHDAVGLAARPLEEEDMLPATAGNPRAFERQTIDRVA